MLREYVDRLWCWRRAPSSSTVRKFVETEHQQTLVDDHNETIRIFGYKRDVRKTIISYLGILVSLGILRLVFHWFLKIYIKCTNKREHLWCAERVLIEDNYKEKWKTYTIANISILTLPEDEKHVYYVENNMLREYKKVITFSYKSVRYVLDKHKFVPLRGLGDGLCQNTLHSFQELTAKENASRLHVYGANEIKVPLDSILHLTVLEAVTPFYIFQVCTLTLWFIENYIYYSIVIILLSVSGVASHVYQTRKNQRLLRSKVKLKDSVFVYRKMNPNEVISSKGYENSTFVSDDHEEHLKKIEVCSTQLVPGDIMDVKEGYAYCDAVLLSGTCLVDESMLTGESVHVLKAAIPNNSNTFNTEDSSSHVLFAGTRIVQANGNMKALVLKTGFLTSKGSLVRSIMYPPPVDYKFDRDCLKYCSIMLLISFFFCIYIAIEKTRRNIPLGDVLIKSLDSMTILIPAGLPVLVTIAKLHAIRNLKKLNIFCTNSNAMNIAGATNCICLDKTGTITEEDLKFDGVVLAGQQNIMKMCFPRKINEGMACCHNLANYENELQGDPIEIQMFKTVGAQFNTADHIRLETGEILSILQRYQFSSNLRRMSVIVKTSEGINRIYCKGSPEIILKLCDCESDDEHAMFEKLVKLGYRVLALAYRDLEMKEFYDELPREEIEKRMHFLGYLIFENNLKPESLDVVRQLQMAKFDVKMITGDNIETAISVAKECQIIPPGAHLHVLKHLDMYANLETIQGLKNFQNVLKSVSHFAMTGNVWHMLSTKHERFMIALLPKTRVFARMTSNQKQQVIEYLQFQKNNVCMCGDGTNDCSALKAANVGISLAESESSIAAPLTSKIPNISAVIHVIREGRGALVTLLYIVQLLLTVNITQYVGVFMLYQIDSSFADLQFLYMDSHSLMFTFFAGSIDAYPGPLSPKAPISSLVSLKPIVSLLSHLIITIAFQLIALTMLRSAAWFVPYVHNSEKGNDFLGYENYVLFSICLLQYISAPVILSKSKPYRKALWTNWKLCICMLFFLVLSLTVTLLPNEHLDQFLSLKVVPDVNFRYMLVALGLGHFITGLVVEEVILEHLLTKVYERFYQKKSQVTKQDSGEEYF